MNHKRHRPKNRRAGCLMCKPWKANGAKPSGWGCPGGGLLRALVRAAQEEKETGML